MPPACPVVPCAMRHCLALYLPALHELDHLAVRPGHEGNSNLGQWIGAELPGHGLDARFCTAGYRTGVGSVGIGDA